MEMKSTPVSAIGRKVFRASRCKRNRFYQCVQAEIIQHHTVGAGSQCLFQFRHVLHLNLHRLAGSVGARSADGGLHATAGGDVILFDKKGIEKADAMVETAAAAHGELCGNCIIFKGRALCGVRRASRHSRQTQRVRAALSKTSSRCEMAS